MTSKGEFAEFKIGGESRSRDEGLYIWIEANARRYTCPLKCW